MRRKECAGQGHLVLSVTSGGERGDADAEGDCRTRS
jgi:hypothetical protein